MHYQLAEIFNKAYINNAKMKGSELWVFAFQTQKGSNKLTLERMRQIQL